MTFRLPYFLLAAIVFVIEVLIALFVRDAIIRPYVGDVLVVMLIYAFLRAFFKISVRTAAVATLAFAFLVEFLQYVNIVDFLGLRHNTMARIVLGTSFSWEDLFMYALGIAIVLIAERPFEKRAS